MYNGDEPPSVPVTVCGGRRSNSERDFYIVASHGILKVPFRSPEGADMGREARRTITESEALRALAHPVRYELITYLMSNSPATASQCARAVGDTPSNCSYHLRALEKAGLVAAEESTDGRERPWRALVTGFEVSPDADLGSPEGRRATVIAALTVQRDQRLVREHLARRERIAPPWLDADQYSTYTLRLTPGELRALAERLDALIRPYLAPTRDDAPPGSALVHFGFHGFPHTDPAAGSAGRPSGGSR
jgi:DNA-binding transcriptional ArsR family regulator